MFYRTIRLLSNEIKPVFVFDGKPPTLKSGEVYFLLFIFLFYFILFYYCTWMLMYIYYYIDDKVLHKIVKKIFYKLFCWYVSVLSLHFFRFVSFHHYLVLIYYIYIFFLLACTSQKKGC